MPMAPPPVPYALEPDVPCSQSSVGSASGRRRPMHSCKFRTHRIKYYAHPVNNFVAECSVHKGGRCRLTKTNVPRDSVDFATRGRPLAELGAWLAFAPPGCDKNFHVQEFKPSDAQVQEIREELETLRWLDQEWDEMLDTEPDP